MMRTEKILFPLALLLLCSSVYMQFIAGNVGDKDWLLAAAHLWLTGKKLYVNLIEVNPPLIIWLYAVPEYVAMHTHLANDSYMLVFFGLLMVAAVIFLSHLLLQRHPEFIDDKRKQYLHALLLAFVFIFYTIPSSFLDREHIFLLLTFPYLLRFSPSLARATLPLWLRLTCGLIAVVGFCMKPHTLVVFAGVQLLYIVMERNLRILVSVENILIYIGGISYLCAVWFFTPEYFTVILPMAIATYGAWNGRAGSITFVLIAALTFGIPFADFRLRYTSPYRRDILYFAGLCLFFLAYALINNGWGYTYNPLISITLIVTGWLWWEYQYLKKKYELLGQPAKLFLFGSRACIISLAANIGLILASYMTVLTYDCAAHAGCQIEKEYSQVVTGPEGLKSFGGMNFQSYVWCDLIRSSGAQWQTRFGVLWMLPSFFISGPDFTRAHQGILKYVADAFAEDLNTGKPQIMLVDASPEFYTTHVHLDLPKFFSTYPAFKDRY